MEGQVEIHVGKLQLNSRTFHPEPCTARCTCNGGRVSHRFHAVLHVLGLKHRLCYLFQWRRGGIYAIGEKNPDQIKDQMGVCPVESQCNLVHVNVMSPEPRPGCNEPQFIWHASDDNILASDTAFLAPTRLRYLPLCWLCAFLAPKLQCCNCDWALSGGGALYSLLLVTTSVCWGPDGRTYTNDACRGAPRTTVTLLLTAAEFVPL